ncbi:hypothetical protein GZ77_15580 [Endozoicomonas montiporae]|uniref:Uncharacterized protein n=2 Tax=Endozoicomonas montiporae TaxID=1027273 RepID=A0A081N5J3_9GAMM|nr:hypothetical protein [Endozoicomonas montiporae]AMO57392.1 hypothetical protein EZMO1_3401 [Endozoicomonas montiporae CL-33]KEQ13716.1 hypothetical protein GZ77_15580 [Endozoicomonas montiporae]
MRDDDKKIKAVPDLSISADERPERRQSKGTARKIKEAEVPEPVKKPGNGLSWLLLAMVVAIGGLGTWQFVEMQKALEETRTQLQNAKDNLSQVTGEVSATGENLNQSDSSIRSELKVVNSEIRKLWDVSNKRNRQWILINKDNVVKATKKAEAAAAEADKANKAIAGLNKEVRDASQSLKAISTEQVAAQSEVTINLQAMRKEMEALQSELARQKKLNVELQQRIADQSDAVKSMDNFRQQVNRQILQLEGTVREFTQPPEQGLGLE